MIFWALNTSLSHEWDINLSDAEYIGTQPAYKNPRGVLIRPTACVKYGCKNTTISAVNDSR